MNAFVVGASGRLIDAVKAHLAVVPVGEVGPLIARGAVTVNDRVARINDRIEPGDRLSVDPSSIAEIAWSAESTSIAIVSEDDGCVVVDKPHGMHVHPIGPYRSGTLVNAMLHHAGSRPDRPWAAWRPHPAHRLDRAAGGLVAIAKSAAVHEALRARFAAHQIERRYHATVRGLVERDAGTIDAALGRDPQFDYRRAVIASGQPAVTHFTVVRRDDVANTTLVELLLETGRTHQIRAHLASIGHPIVGDTLYGERATPSDSIALRAITLVL